MTSIKSGGIKINRDRAFSDSGPSIREISEKDRLEKQVDDNAGAECPQERQNMALGLNQGVPVELNECVEINLTPSVSVQGQVIWVNGSNCGIGFGERRESAADHREGNIEPISSGIGMSDNNLANASAFVPGLRVKVRLADNHEKHAAVHWSVGNFAELVLL